MKIVTLIVFSFAFSLACFAQETNKGKKMWAQSFLNKKAPKFKVQEWVSEKPELTGKFVLVDFWATWCGPCRSTIPHLNSIQNKYSGDLIVIGISDESKEKVQTMAAPSINYFSAIDQNRTMYNKMEIKGIPHCLLISPAGTVVWEGYPLLAGNMLTIKVVGDLIKKYK